MTSDAFFVPPFTASYAPDDGVMAARLLETAHLNAGQNERIDRAATRLIDAIRASDDRLGGV
jgi:RHH-type transcriptional regulator, proline utilization regulon repressor / proline dehydrogenase / delta 1-pyrroline-5-carboxylate dehydrogenase